MVKNILLLAASATLASATVQNTWINWNGTGVTYPINRYVSSEGTSINYRTTLTGTVSLPASMGSALIDVTFNGEVTEQSVLFVGGPSFNVFANTSSYLSNSVVSPAPNGEYIAITGYSNLTNTLTFSAPVTNLIMAISSLGGATDAAYQFDQQFVVNSRGPGKWGNPAITLYSANEGTMAYGMEANGVIQFNGSISSLSWTIPSREIFSVFTLGLSNTPGVAMANSVWTGIAPSWSPIPEPSTYGFIIGALALAGAAIRRRKQAQ